MMTHMVKTLPVAEAKAHLARHIRDAERGGRVVITRHGRPAAALVSIRDLESVERQATGRPGGGLASLVGSVDGAGDFAARLDRIRRGRRPGRRLPDLG